MYSYYTIVLILFLIHIETLRITYLCFKKLVSLQIIEDEGFTFNLIIL